MTTDITPPELKELRKNYLKWRENVAGQTGGPVIVTKIAQFQCHLPKEINANEIIMDKPKGKHGHSYLHHTVFEEYFTPLNPRSGKFKNNTRARLFITGYIGVKKCIAFMQAHDGMAPKEILEENPDEANNMDEEEETGAQGGAHVKKRQRQEEHNDMTSEDVEDDESGIEDEEDCSQDSGPTAATRYAARRKSLPQPVTPLMLTYGQQRTAGQQPSPQPQSPIEETLCRILLDAAKQAAKQAAKDANEAVAAAKLEVAQLQGQLQEQLQAQQESNNAMVLQKEHHEQKVAQQSAQHQLQLEQQEAALVAGMAGQAAAQHAAQVAQAQLQEQQAQSNNALVLQKERYENKVAQLVAEHQLQLGRQEAACKEAAQREVFVVQMLLASQDQIVQLQAREREQQQEAQVAVEALAACKEQVAKLQAREQEQQQEAQVARKALTAYKQEVVELQEMRRAMLRAGGASDLDLL